MCVEPMLAAQRPVATTMKMATKKTLLVGGARRKSPPIRIRSPMTLLAGLLCTFCIVPFVLQAGAPMRIREGDFDAPGAADALRRDYAAGRPLVRRGLREREPAAVHDNSTAPSRLREAIDSCEEAMYEFGEYPSVYREIVGKRRQRWRQENTTHAIDFLQMINHKLGGFLYATKVGILTPRVLFCGAAKDLDIASLGKSYVVKPLNGHSARGVKVVKDGVDILTGKEISYSTLARKPEEETIVEERIHSAHPKYRGLVPPDYKFFIFRGRPETMWFIDRNEGQHCKDYFDSSDASWRYLEDFEDGVPQCPPRQGPFPRHHLGSGRKAAMADAVAGLASRIGQDWIRIDMFNSERGPMLGEFTPFSADGRARPLDSCVMSYLFIAHAEDGGPSDDAETLRGLEGGAIGDFKRRTKMRGARRSGGSEGRDARPVDALGFSPEEIEEWNASSELEKCKRVMEAQGGFAGA